MKRFVPDNWQLTHDFIIRRFRPRKSGDSGPTRVIEYWTGNTWTSLAMFARKFDYAEGQQLIQKRFHRLKPLPELIVPPKNSEQ